MTAAHHRPVSQVDVLEENTEKENTHNTNKQNKTIQNKTNIWRGPLATCSRTERVMGEGRGSKSIDFKELRDSNPCSANRS
jgi:hypothetical protein